MAMSNGGWSRRLLLRGSCDFESRRIERAALRGVSVPLNAPRAAALEQEFEVLAPLPLPHSQITSLLTVACG